ncbi:hypothetical protein HanIR_Chr09g0394801 [Helianthus annuus]|nr:hypothetical protein HanIR_Chr09g0394801 [Helianthus annuus]
MLRLAAHQSPPLKLDDQQSHATDFPSLPAQKPLQDLYLLHQLALILSGVLQEPLQSYTHHFYRLVDQ